MGLNQYVPKFTTSLSLPSWESALKKLDALKAQRNSIDSDIKEIEAALKQAHQLSDTQGWIESGGYRFRLAQVKGRKTLNKDALLNELTDLFEREHITDIAPAALVAQCEREGASSSRLQISPINC